MLPSVQLDCFAYGKTGVHLLKVERHGTRHDLRQLNVAIQVFGTFEEAYPQGDNRAILPTDTMKNAVYVLARQQLLGDIEDFGTRIANHLLTHNPHLTRVRIGISEKLWERIVCNGNAADAAFQMSGPEYPTASIDATRTETSVRSGIKNLEVLKSSRSAFENFLRDEYTTLKDTRDRLLASSVNAEWSYDSDVKDFKGMWNSVRAVLLNAFATHDSRSVQHTLYAMGQAVLQQINPIERISLSMPNSHCLLVDLSPFYLDNPNEVFLRVEEPSGSIEATLSRRAQSMPEPQA